MTGDRERAELLRASGGAEDVDLAELAPGEIDVAVALEPNILGYSFGF